MAAHSSIALTFVKPGDSVLHGRPIYGGVDMLYGSVMPGFGTHVETYTDGCDPDHVRAAARAALAKGPLALIVAETPANPTAAIVDLDLMVAVADEIGRETGRRPLVVVDNTLLGPFAQRPIEQGVDLNMTSLTKYCAGHSDLLAGGVTGKLELIHQLRTLRTTWGNHLDPFTAWLVVRSLESASVRIERAMANARKVAEFLQGHPKVAGVTYLGFLKEGTPARAVYDRQCKGAGSTFSFHLQGGEAESFRMLDALKLLKLAVSLGGSETLICHSATTTHYAVPREGRLAGGITDGTMRLSVGLEHAEGHLRALEHQVEPLELVVVDHRRPVARDAVDDLQPVLVVALQLHRSEHSAETLLAEGLGPSSEQSVDDSAPIVHANRRLHEVVLREALVPVVDRLVALAALADGDALAVVPAVRVEHALLDDAARLAHPAAVLLIARNGIASALEAAVVSPRWTASITAQAIKELAQSKRIVLSAHGEVRQGLHGIRRLLDTSSEN